MRQWLKEGFDYDLWANSAWVECLPRFKDPQAAEGVMTHVLRAQVIWIDRILDRARSSEEYQQMTGDLDALARTHAEWSSWLEVADLEAFKDLRRMDGTVFNYRLGDVARHVINHGTYHRGHLRGLAQAEGLTTFPETDLVLWLRDTGRAAIVEPTGSGG